MCSQRNWTIFKSVAGAAGIALVFVAVWAIFSIVIDPEREEVPDTEVAFDQIFESAILSADAYALSENELVSKYAGEDEIYVRDLPASQLRYVLLIDDDGKTQKIAIRGTANARNIVVDVDYIKRIDPTLGVYLHRGFRDASDELLADISPLLKRDYRTSITGHSLGGAVAAIVLLRLEQQGFQVDHTVTFGQPKVTNVDGATKFSKKNLVRIINLNDVVTRVPPGSLLANLSQPYRHFAPEIVMLEDDSYLYQRPILQSDEEIEAAADQLDQERTRGLGDDYLMAHRMANYVARLQRVIESDRKVDAAKMKLSTPTPNPTSANPQQHRFALLVGIDDYQDDSIPDLRGCVNDVHSMKNLLVGQFGFPVENVRVLSNSTATHEEILHAIDRSLVQRAGKDDTVVFHFSGHGSQMKDASGDETDQWDETIVPYDSRTEGVFDITDDELNRRFRDLADKTNLTVILDCCHSGSGLRAISARQIARDEREQPAPTPGARRDAKDVAATGFRENLDYTMIAASQADELANELNIQVDSHGALTHFFVLEAQRSPDSATYRDVMDRVKIAVNNVFRSQHPQIEGSEIDNRLFGSADVPIAPYISVSLRSSGSPVLIAGEAQGMTKGSVFDVYAPSTKNFESAEPIAKIELTEIRPFTSEAKVISGESIPYAARAIERSHVYADFKFFVFAPGESRLETQLKYALAKHKHVQLVGSESEAQIEIGLQDGKLVVSAPQQGMSKTFDDSPENAIDLAERLVLHWSKWFNLLLLDNPDSALAIELQIGDQLGETSFVAGQRVPVTVRNTSNRDLYFTILDLESTGDVTIIYPRGEGQNAKLSAGGDWTGRFRFNVPGDKEVRDFIKVIGTREPIDARFLEMETPDDLRGANPLAELLREAAFGSRKATLVTVKNDAWTTALRQVTVRPKK